MARSLREVIESLLRSGRCPRIEIDLSEQGVVCPDVVRAQHGPRLVIDFAAEVTNELTLGESSIVIGVRVDGGTGSEQRFECCQFPWAAVREIVERDAVCSAAFRETAAAATATATASEVTGRATAASPNPATNWTPGQLIGLVYEATTMSVREYRVMSRLGRGAFGVVDLVCVWNDDEDGPTEFGKPVSRSRYAAVKSPQRDINYSPTELERFFSEGTAWLALPPHRNVVTCHSVRWISGLPRIFAEYVSGGSLAEWITAGRLVDLESILGVAIELAQGIEHAHRHGIIHQDIKPANVLMRESGVAMLTDFGLARVGRPVPASRLVATRNSSGVNSLAASLVGGTPGFWAPEVEWTGMVSRRSDVWSWAVTVLAMFVQTAPMPDEYGDAWLEQIAGGRLRSNVPLPERVLTLLRRCLAREPEARPEMNEIVEILEHIYHRILHKSYGPRREPRRGIPIDDEHDRAISWIELGRQDKAEAMLRIVLEKHPLHTLAAYNLGLIELRKGIVTSQQLIDRLEKYPPRIELPFDIVRACIVAEEGDCAEALAILNGVDVWPRKYTWVNENGDELRGLQSEEHVHGWNLGPRSVVRIVPRPSSADHFFALLRLRVDHGPFIAPFLLSA